MKPYFLSLLFALAATALAAEVRVVPAEGGKPPMLTLDGKPYFVRGVTYSGPAKGGDLDADLAAIAGMGANTIRTWGTDAKSTPLLLDAARKHGLHVMLGLWLRHGRPGAEGIDNFNYLTDKKGMQEQRESVLQQVRAFHRHPAVLMWGLGNEVTLNIATDAEKASYAKFLEELVVSIKKIDTSRPVASVSAWSTDWTWWRDHTPSLDVYGINAYGYGAAAIPGEAKRLGVDKPYLICEFGASGEWEAQTDENGVKVEPDDAHKRSIIHPGFRDLIEAKRGEGCLGGFVFHLGNGFDHTGLWLSLRVDGYWRPQYWATREAFTGKPADNEVPVVEFFRVRRSPNGHAAGEWVEVALVYKDKENANCRVEFAGNLRSLPWPQKDEVHRFESRPGDRPDRWMVRMPDKPGAWKFYALVYDPAGNLGAATTSVIVRAAK